MASFGESLRREREIRGVSLQEISAATKIGVRSLEAIEEDRLDKLPQGIFVRGFVREYARFLALDEQKTLTELSFHESQTASDGLVFSRGHHTASHEASGVSSRFVNVALAAGCLGAVVGLILIPGWAKPIGTAAARPALSLPLPGDAPLPSRNEEAAQEGAAAAASSVLPQPLQLTLTATEDCWIGLDVGGDRVENRVLKKGESISISARQNASLAVGNAGGLLVAIDSGPQRPLGNRGEVKRNIPLSPEALGALSAGSQAPPAKPIG